MSAVDEARDALQPLVSPIVNRLIDELIAAVRAETLDVTALARAMETVSDQYTAAVVADPTLDEGRNTEWLTANRFSWHKHAVKVATEYRAALEQKR